jgi:hypothetical protein
MVEATSQKYSNHNVIYEGHKYKLIQLLDEEDFVMNEDGPHYDCLFLDKSTNQSLGTFRYIDAEKVEVTNMRLDGTLRFKSVKKLIEQLPRLTNNKSFIQPSVGDLKVVYRSKRFCIIEINENDMYEFNDKSMCDYVFWDGKYGAVSALINTNKNGTFTVTAMTQWGNQMTFKTMKDLALEAPMFIHRAFNEQDRGTY